MSYFFFQRLRFRLSLSNIPYTSPLHVMRSACVRKYKPMGQKVYACARVYSLLTKLYDETIEVHCACIHILT